MRNVCKYRLPDRCQGGSMHNTGPAQQDFEWGGEGA